MSPQPKPILPGKTPAPPPRPQPVAKRTAAPPRPSAPSTLDVVFDRLLRELVSGTYVPGARLPAERDLATSLGASRPTVREALRRLAGWGLIEARRGSGITVRPRREWAMDVLPAYLRYGAAADGPAAVGALVRDLLAVRRGLVLEVLRLVGPRIRPGALAEPRRRVQAAWAARAQVERFVHEDFEALRALAEAAGFLPGVWLLGTLGGVYHALATHLTGAALAPPDYLRAYRAAFDALEAGQPERAQALFAAYLDRHDRRLLAALGLARAPAEVRR